MMRIKLTSIPVLDQEQALTFYTETLGFVKKHDIPVGEGARWLTVVARDEQDGPELLLEPAPNHFEPAKVYQKALYEAGIPHAQFDVDDIEAEHARLTSLGVKFSVPPTDIGTAKLAVLDDTCGNHIQLLQSL